MTKNKQINIEAPDDLEKIEEDIIKAAEKAGKKNVIVNIFTYPHKKLKKRWHVRYKFNKKHLLMDLVIAAGVLVLIGLNIFWLWGGFHYFGSKMDVRIVTEQEGVGLARFVDAEIKYSNENKFEVQDFNLSLTMPGDYELIEVAKEGYDYERNTINLGDLKPGANGSFKLTMQAFADTGESNNLILNASYYKTNKKGERLWGQFHETILQKFTIISTFVELQEDVPRKLVKNQAFQIPIQIINKSDFYNMNIDMEKIEFRMYWDGELITSPENFTVYDFASGEEVRFVVNHFAKSDDTKSKTLEYELIWTRDGKEYKQWANGYMTEIFDPEFEVNFDLNIDEAVTPGETVPITVSYTNDGQYSIESLELNLELASPYWNMDKFKSDFGGFVYKQNNLKRIVWSYKHIPSLAIIQPGESKSFEVEVPTYNYIANAPSTSLSGHIVQSYKVEGQAVEIIGSSSGLKLNSNLSMKAYPMYYAVTGDQLGRGPIPPRVGKETKYWVFMKMLNDINDVENVTVSAKLPFNVVWLNESNVPVGDPIIYNSENKTISWNISQVSVDVYNLGFAFQVAIIPTASQQGSYPALLTDVKVSGTDKVTGKFIEKNLGVVTTRLIYDNKGKLKDGPVK